MLGKILAPVFGLLLLATGCASIVDGRTQAVVFNSTPDGAEVIYNSTKLGVTPFTTIFQRSDADRVVVTVKKEGYEDQTLKLTTRMNYWFWGNIILGGLIGSTTDFVSGAYTEFEPDKYFINLIPKKASEAEREEIKKIAWARTFILAGYSHLENELATGEGEYLRSLHALLGVKENGEGANETLRQLMVHHSHDIPSFAQAVLKHFGWEPEQAPGIVLSVHRQ
jgi:hypothetical protein